MNSLERYTLALRGEAVDFLPRTPILMQFAAEHIGSDYAHFASDHRVLVEANRKCAAEFGFDQVSVISDAYRETQGFGSTVKYVKDGPPHSTHPLVDSQDLSLLLKPDPRESERMLDRVRAVAAYKALDDDYSILGWVEGPAAEAATLRDSTGFLIDLIDDEVYACALMDVCLQVAIEFAQAQVNAGADTVGIGDAIASQVSPDLYGRLIQPREKQLIRAIKDMGAFTKLHICGNTTHLLAGIADLGVDVLDVDHMVDLTTVRAAVGGAVAIAGNVDPVGEILNGTPAGIRQAVRRCYESVGKPYIVNAGCEIPAGTPIENLKALCEPIPG